MLKAHWLKRHHRVPRRYYFVFHVMVELLLDAWLREMRYEPLERLRWQRWYQLPDLEQLHRAILRQGVRPSIASSFIHLIASGRLWFYNLERAIFVIQRSFPNLPPGWIHTVQSFYRLMTGSQSAWKWYEWLHTWRARYTFRYA